MADSAGCRLRFNEVLSLKFKVQSFFSSNSELITFNYTIHNRKWRNKMVKLRLTRIGKKKTPFYRIIAAESSSPRDGRFIEQIGTYDPNQEPAAVNIDADLARKWLANGAQPTATVARLFKNAGIEK
jgi:small subunit ribosomal protein S16